MLVDVSISPSSTSFNLLQLPFAYWYYWWHYSVTTGTTGTTGDYWYYWHFWLQNLAIADFTSHRFGAACANCPRNAAMRSTFCPMIGPMRLSVQSRACLGHAVPWYQTVLPFFFQLREPSPGLCCLSDRSRSSAYFWSRRFASPHRGRLCPATLMPLGHGSCGVR